MMAGDAPQCFGGKALAAICSLLAQHYHLYASGFPDLTLWRPETRELRIVEVKGKGDRLSGRQTLWLQELVGMGVRVEVCHVAEG
jgi:Fanconi-associated nuclease 1